jgi:hypothetical protein
VLFIAAIWAVGAYFIWRYGAGLRLRTVWCPVLKKRATILAVQRRAHAPGGLAVMDVKACSLLRGGFLNCRGECVHPGIQGIRAD